MPPPPPPLPPSPPELALLDEVPVGVALSPQELAPRPPPRARAQSPTSMEMDRLWKEEAELTR
jgi:hypothetical protein